MCVCAHGPNHTSCHNEVLPCLKTKSNPFSSLIFQSQAPGPPQQHGRALSLAQMPGRIYRDANNQRFLYNDIKITAQAEGVLQDMFASESDLNLSQAENPPVEVTLLAWRAGRGSSFLHGAAPLAARFPLPFWHWVIFSFLKQL